MQRGTHVPRLISTASGTNAALSHHDHGMPGTVSCDSTAIVASLSQQFSYRPLLQGTPAGGARRQVEVAVGGKNASM